MGIRTACTLTGDTAYQALLGHTLVCPACKSSGAKCKVAAQLDRAWRQARGAAPSRPLGQQPRRPVLSLEGDTR